MPSLPRTPILVLFSLHIASAFFLSIYFYNRPLPLTTPRKITTTRTLSFSCTANSTSKSLSIVNPNSHISDPDSISIKLLKSEIGGLKDEEILAKFLKGFFSGWSFLPERTYLGALGLMGRTFIPVGFTDVQTGGPLLPSPNDLSKTKLPEKYSKLFHGNFMVLDVKIRDQDPKNLDEKSEESLESYVDIAFGDDRKGFAGFHRLEVSRDEESGEGGTTLCYSSIACNPSVKKFPMPRILFSFHRWYGMCLFRDGVEMVLRK
ncbi:hypothetical protein IFR05_005487 [Cadophora sp. M221]|nr:hypothetical protein IFR05_005487 [Cadophora sp. M221]